jgi:hypothetical protein
MRDGNIHDQAQDHTAHDEVSKAKSPEPPRVDNGQRIIDSELIERTARRYKTHEAVLEDLWELREKAHKAAEEYASIIDLLERTADHIATQFPTTTSDTGAIEQQKAVDRTANEYEDPRAILQDLVALKKRARKEPGVHDDQIELLKRTYAQAVALNPAAVRRPSSNAAGLTSIGFKPTIDTQGLKQVVSDIMASLPANVSADEVAAALAKLLKEP